MTPDRPRRVLLADVPGNARRSIAALLATIDGVTLAGEVGSRAEIARALRKTHADVLVIDDRLLSPGDHPLAGFGPLPEPVRTIVIGMHDEPGFAARARRLGAEAWVAKERADDELRPLLTDSP